MPKVHRDVCVDADVLEAAKALTYPDGTAFNVSGEFNEFLKIRTAQIKGTPSDLTGELAAAKAKVAALEAGAELIKPKPLPDAVSKNLDEWAALIKGDNKQLSWKKFIPGRIRALKHLFNFDMSQFEIEAAVEQRLKDDKITPKKMEIEGSMSGGRIVRL